MSGDRTTATLTAIDDLADSWADQRLERLARRRLDPADFEALAGTGFLRLIVPEEHGGVWQSLRQTGPTIVQAIGRIAEVDQSVALVASMHPTVVGFWAASPTAPEPDREAWDVQRADVFQTALDGHFWGTLTSEPGSGGDVLSTKATAEPIEGSRAFALFGDKHFGSGSEVVSFMITTARHHRSDGSDGSDEIPMAFSLDLREQPWDGTGGLEITRRWDGMGMKATQSHAVRLDGIHGVPWAWQGGMLEGASTISALGLTAFCAVITAICDSAMAAAEQRLSGRPLRPYEEVLHTQAEIDHWMITQAMNGLTSSLGAQPTEVALIEATKAKVGIAELAETFMTRVCRAVGGGAFSGSSPFASWYEDVRALGYLRPPWALAFDQLAQVRNPDS